MTWDWWRMNRGCPGREGVVVVVVVGAGEKNIYNNNSNKWHRRVAKPCPFSIIYTASNCPPACSNKLDNFIICDIYRLLISRYIFTMNFSLASVVTSNAHREIGLLS